MTNFQNSILHLLENNDYPEVVKALLQVIVENKDSCCYGAARNQILTTHGIRRITDIKAYTPQVILDFAEQCLQDGFITEDEIKQMKLLKMYLGIEEGDFRKNNKEKIVYQIILRHMELLYADGVIDTQEDIFKTEMQGLFGMGFDEYATLEKLVAHK